MRKVACFIVLVFGAALVLSAQSNAQSGERGRPPAGDTKNNPQGIVRDLALTSDSSAFSTLAPKRRVARL